MSREEWNRRYDTADLLWTARPNQLLVGEVEALLPGRALDVGTGEGRNAVWLAERGWEVTGVDFSDVGLEKARRLAEARGVTVEWVAADLVDYRPEPEAFDLVMILYLHLPAPERGVVHAAAARALRPDGTLLVIGHDRTNLTEGFGGPQDPSILFSPEDVLDDLAAVAGLSVLRADRVHRIVATDAGDRTAVDALVRLERRGTPGGRVSQSGNGEDFRSPTRRSP